MICIYLCGTIYWACI